MTSGRYTFEREIGRGASGTVHLGRDTLLGRDVALKRVGYVPGGTSPEEVRAEREARIAASLTHPHLVGVYDLVHVGDSFWLVMEYVDGTSLSALVADEGALEPERARLLVGHLAAALTTVHAHGVVHRDVKPSNVLVAHPGTVMESAKLSDFGIARGRDDQALTRTGLVTGSPAYLSPEVVTGGRATQASDVWALGATLFHLLAGHPPYESSENVLSTMFRIVNEEPPRLDTEPRLAEALARTMVVDPDARWSAEQVRDHLLGPRRRPRTEVVWSSTATSPSASPAPSSAEAVPAAASDAVGEEGTDTHAWLPLVERSPLAARAVERPLWHWVVLAGVVTAATVVAFVLGVSGTPGSDDRGDDGTRSGTRTSAAEPQGGATEEPEDASPSPTPTPEPTGDAEPEPEAPTRQSVEEFARTYLVAAPNDPATAWSRLTPSFQAQSGGYDGFLGWWSTVRSAEPLAITGDAESLRVSYTVRYTMRSGRTSTENVSLQLVERDGRLLIDGEA